MSGGAGLQRRRACRGDVLERRQNVQSLIEIERFGLADRGAQSIPQLGQRPPRAEVVAATRARTGEPFAQRGVERGEGIRGAAIGRPPRRDAGSGADRPAATRRSPRRSARRGPARRDRAGAAPRAPSRRRAPPPAPVAPDRSRPTADRGCRSSLRSRRRQTVEQQPAAARADGRQQPPRLVRDDQDQRARRRLLDHLQQRVGAGGIELVGAIDDRRRASRRTPPTYETSTARRARPRRGFRNRSPSTWRSIRAAPGRNRGATAPPAGAPPDGRRATERSRALAHRRAPPGRDWRARSARSARRASPCRSLRGRRSARRGRAGSSR